MLQLLAGEVGATTLVVKHPWRNGLTGTTRQVQRIIRWD